MSERELFRLNELEMISERGILIKHTIGQNQELYENYGIHGSVHIEETEQLCEIIRTLEKKLEEKYYE